MPRDANIVYKKPKHPAPQGARLGVFKPRTPEQALGVEPLTTHAPNQAPFRAGRAPAQVATKRINAQRAASPVPRNPIDPRVVQIQQHLVDLGYHVSIDGVMGPETRAAIAISNHGTTPNVVHHTDHSDLQAAKHTAKEYASRFLREVRSTPTPEGMAGIVKTQLTEPRPGENVIEPRPVQTVQAGREPEVRTSYTPFYKGQKPDHYENNAPVAGGVGMDAPRGSAGVGAEPRGKRVPVYVLPHAGPVGELGLNAEQAAETQKMNVENQGGLFPYIVKTGLESLVPQRSVNAIKNGHAPSAGDIASDVFNGALWLSPGAVAPALRTVRLATQAFREEGITANALRTVREVRGAIRTSSEDAGALARAEKIAKTEQKLEGPVVSPVKDQIAAALSQSNIPEKQQRAILEANDVAARAVAHTTGTTPEHAYELMWKGAQFHDASPTVGQMHTFAQALHQTGDEPEVTNLAQTPETIHKNPAPIDRAARSLVRNSAVKDAAPPHARGQKATKALLLDLQQRAIEAADYRHWYAHSAAGILQHVNGDKAAADQLAALIAVYSPRAEVYSKTNEWNNLDRAINAFDEFHETGQISPRWSISSHKTGEGDWQTFRAQQIMEGNFAWDGLKTNRFYRNFLQHIDPEKYAATFGDEKFTTIDTWMRRAFGYPARETGATKTEETLLGPQTKLVGKSKKDETITSKMYEYMDRATKAVAESLGWAPEEAQAAIWTSIKAEAEGTPLGQAGFDFRDAFLHREARRARPVGPEQLGLDTEAATADTPRQGAVQDAIDASRAPDSGFTLTAGLNPDAGRAGYAVAYGAFEYREPAPLTAKGLLDFRNKHLALLRSDPELRVGGWHNPADGHVYLDISKVFDSKDEAMQFAREQGQVAIFDRANMDVVNTGLSPEEADSIKAGLREQGRLHERAAKYDDMLQGAWKLLTGKNVKTLTADQRNQAEQYIFDFADSPAGKEYKDQIYDLMHDAALAKQSPDPNMLFQDDALVQAIATARGRDVGKEQILDYYQGKNLKGLPKTRRSNAKAQVIAEKYMDATGMRYTPPTEYAKVDPARARRIADWYDAAVDAPHDPEVRAAYDAMARETLEQYRAIQREGYIFEFYPEGVDPYPDGPSQAIDDLRSNRHMYVFPTEGGFGSLTEAQAAHPLLADSGEEWGGKKVTHNDIFRAVHDFMGHFKEGVGFRADGEENAWRAHSAMYSPDARRAMTSETRGQNSWVNYGPHGDANKTASQAETVYADQKAVLAPDWVVEEGSGQPKMLAQEGDTFPAWWNSKNVGGDLTEVYKDARSWLSDIQWRDMEPEDIEALPDEAIDKAIDRLYDGGMEQFISDGQYFGDSVPQWFAQAEPRVKGAVERTAKGAILHLFQGADTSTAIHELAHAVEPLMPANARAALMSAAEQAGEGYDEFVARSMERYFMTGEVPVPWLQQSRMKRTFRTLSKAMYDVYGDAARIPGGALSPEVRQVFDSWFAREAKLDPAWAAKVAAGEEDTRDFMTRWRAQEENPPEDFSFDDDSLARTHEPSAVPPPWTRGEPNQPPPEPLSTAEQAQQGLKGARRAAKAQKLAYSEERSARFKRAEAIMHDETLDPLERHRRAKNELRGELPKIEFHGFKELDEDALSAMVGHIQTHPNLSPGERIRAADALQDAVFGKTPTPKQILLLEHVFGKATTSGLQKLSEHPFRAQLLDLLNIPRSLMSSFDLSAPFRQGLVAGARHPAMFAKNFAPMIKAMKSEQYYADVEQAIHEDPDYPMALEAGLALTDFESQLTREERYFSSAAERFTGGKYSPVRASGRAYVTFLNKMRMDMFKYHLRAADDMGLDIHDQHFLSSLAEVINSATGRGGGGEKFERAAGALNTFLFSPRLLKSRLNFLNPFFYKGLDKYARRLAIRSFVTLGGEAATLLGILSQVPGVKVATDPRNPDWGKVRIGNTRIDIGGGFQQEIRLGAQIATGVAISSTTGKASSLTSSGFGDPTKLDMLLRFFEGKESPIASFVTDYLRNSDQVGNKFEIKREVASRMIPLLAQDSYDLYRSGDRGMNGIALAAAGYGVGAFGFGIQTYAAAVPGKKQTAKLVQEAKDAGLPPPPKEVLIDLQHKAKLDAISQGHKSDNVGKMTEALQYYAQTTGDHSYDKVGRQIAAAKSDKDAETMYRMIRTFMIGSGVSQYERAIKAANGG